MKYFDTLPDIVYTDKALVSRLFTNIMARASFVSQVKDKPEYFYDYTIQDEDTPEIVAYKYYGDTYRYWLLLVMNEIMDPLWDWPLSGRQFEAFVQDKYPGTTISDAHHYEKVITQYDEASLTTTVNKIIIDEATYNSFMESTETYTFPYGNLVVTTTANAVTNYEYEHELNENKKNIKILNKIYATQAEQELKKMMG